MVVNRVANKEKGDKILETRGITAENGHVALGTRGKHDKTSQTSSREMEWGLINEAKQGVIQARK